MHLGRGVVAETRDPAGGGGDEADPSEAGPKKEKPGGSRRVFPFGSQRDQKLRWMRVEKVQP